MKDGRVKTEDGREGRVEEDAGAGRAGLEGRFANGGAVNRIRDSPEGFLWKSLEEKAPNRQLAGHTPWVGRTR